VRFKGFEKGVVEIMKLSTPVKATGNVEDWLRKLQGEMQKTVRN
jgi:dynein heavy chain